MAAPECCIADRKKCVGKGGSMGILRCQHTRMDSTCKQVIKSKGKSVALIRFEELFDFVRRPSSNQQAVVLWQTDRRLLLCSDMSSLLVWMAAMG